MRLRWHRVGVAQRAGDMASLQKRGKTYSCVFYWGGKRQWLTLGNVTEKEADSKASQVDYLLMRLKQGLIALPDGVDIVDFIQHDGKPPARQAAPVPHLTLAAFRDRYIAAHSGAHESNTIGTAKTHFRHFAVTLGEGFSITSLSQGDLQGHIERRANAGVAPVTTKKEITSLRAAWNWGRGAGLISREWPGRGLIYRKATDKPPFQTMAEIERQIARGGLDDEQVGDLWDSLYLTAEELPEFLEHVRQAARHAWVYPMCCMAAHTSARRSEMIRAQVNDVDFDAGMLTIREKKRVRGRQTTRRVPLSPFLTDVMKAWLATHPGGNHLFCRGKVARSRTRRDAGSALTRNEAHDHLQRTLGGSKWGAVRGYHVLRHSFISACASKGVDQRLIQEWAGHMSEEMSARYRHLYPSVQRQVMASVFERQQP